LVVGGDGNDTLTGGDGADVLIGELGNDKLVGGFGDDLLVGGSGNVGLQGERGEDELNSGESALEDDEAAQLAALLAWTTSRDSSLLGAKSDDGDRDGLNGGGNQDTLYFGVGDVVFIEGSGDVSIPL
jgi:Ca2+-binding RTX toxin-like protein